VSAAFTDAGLLDTHRVLIDWGDGASSDSDESLADFITFNGDGGGNGSFTATHAYKTGGIFDLNVTVFDDDGGMDTDWTHAVVTGVAVIDHVLYVIGSSNDDHVTVNQQGNGLIKVHADFLPDGNFKTFPVTELEIDTIQIVLGAGDDHATLAGSIALATLIDAGGGDDHINAGGGPSVVLGGYGADMLNGGSGRNILIGGYGPDRLVGGPRENILIGGPSIYDSDPESMTLANDEALIKMLAEWNADRARTIRIANLTDGSGSEDRLNDGFFLLLGETLLDDEESDEVTGSAGEDWLLLFEDDTATGGGSQSGKGGKKK
jgi:hypothetical protein